MTKNKCLQRARRIQKRYKLKYCYDIYNKLLIKYNID